MRPWLLTLAFVLAVAAAWRMDARRDLALHKPVRASGVRLGDPEGVVNGLVEWGTYAFHSERGTPAWLTIDLEAPHRIGEVRVFGRGDGYLTTAPVMVVDLSDDGVHFGQPRPCGAILTQASPCAVAFGGVAARYVRVRATVLVLSEVEVHEAR